MGHVNDAQGSALHARARHLHPITAPLGKGRGRLLLRASALAAAALTALSSAEALAEQFVVVDATYEHTPALADSHYRVTPLSGTPANWRSPIDYASGKAYMHLEVHTKPSATPTRFQACFEATPTYACVDQSPSYTEVGVYDWQTSFSSFWSPPGEMVDWSQGTKKIAIILKDTKNGKPSADNVGSETAKLYSPTKVRMVVTIVAPGSTYVPPAPSVPDDAGAPDAASSGADASASTSGSGPGSSASTGAGGGFAASSGSGSAPDPEPTPSAMGCGCRAAQGSSNEAWIGIIAATGLLGRYRRRRER